MNRIRKTIVRDTLGITLLEKLIEQKQLEWFGYFYRMEEARITKQIMEVCECVRLIGKHPLHFISMVRNNCEQIH